MRKAALFLSLVLAACGSERPVPVNHLASTETVMASAAHWQALAADVADRLVAADPEAGLVAVDMPDGDSSFGVNFHDMLITELFKRGYDIADTAPVHVAFDWHVVHHAPQKADIAGKSFEAVGVGAGVYGLYRLARDTLAPSVGAALGVTAVGGLVAGSWIADNVNSEVVITTTVKDGPHIIHRQTDIYYLEEGETENFHESEGHKPSITLKQTDSATAGLTDLTQQADAYCRKQQAHAVLSRRYVQDDIRYNQFNCVKTEAAGPTGD